MTSSVVTSRDCGMVSPIALATLRLIICLRRAGCSTGIRRLCTVQYLVGVASSLAEVVGHVRPIGHQKTAQRRVILFENETHSLAVNHVI